MRYPPPEMAPLGDVRRTETAMCPAMDGEPWGPGVSDFAQKCVEIAAPGENGQVRGEDRPAVLLHRMRSGDRAAAAEFMSEYGSRIRRRIHGKLGPSMRRLFDSQEILSTLGRRLDTFVHGRRIKAASVPELWALVLKIADNSLLEKARVYRSLQRKEGEDSPLAASMLQHFKDSEARAPDAPELEIGEILRGLDDQLDREVLSLWLLGFRHVHIAESLGMEAATIRKRWQKIRERLRERLESRVS